MANSGDLLKKAYGDGYTAFNTVETNARGFFVNPSNPYAPRSLPFKEWERGYNAAYFDNKR